LSSASFFGVSSFSSFFSFFSSFAGVPLDAPAVAVACSFLPASNSSLNLVAFSELAKRMASCSNE
jgi:hypothetical protein